MNESIAPNAYRGPGVLPLRGHELPLFAIVGAIGTALSWLAVTALNMETLIAGTRGSR